MCIYSFSSEVASPGRDRKGGRKTLGSQEKAGGRGGWVQEGDVMTAVAVNSMELKPRDFNFSSHHKVGLVTHPVFTSISSSENLGQSPLLAIAALL